MIIFKRLLCAAIVGAIGFLGAAAFLKEPTIAIAVGVISIITGWNIPSSAAKKIVSTTEDSVSGRKRSPFVTLLMWLVMFAILVLGLIALGAFMK